MDSSTIRKVFLDFFAERGHTVVPSSSLVPDDPTLLLTNAGMVQFKPYLSGEKPPPYPRAASVQKCFREIDLEEVGKTARHQTFFEMLGNFSFGDYFKTDACLWAWELMTEGYKLDPDRLWVTVFETDDEAAEIWEKDVGVPASRILRRTREDGNFWDMGVAGPCGPCSELLYDRGDAFGQEYTGGELDEERYLEVWNLVFMQNVMNDKGEVIGDLPKLNVDTGMGLERLASILQDVSSNFEIDSMAGILAAAEEVTGHRYGAAGPSDVALRVLSEHARSMTFLIADGVLPGNVGRGYVLRRLIRRAVRYARLSGIEGAILSKLTDVVVDIYSDAYPEVVRNRDLIRKVVDREEARFDLTLRNGLGLLEDEIQRMKAAGETTVNGEIAFKLHDTYGFPVDLTQDIAGDDGFDIDKPAFERLMSQQRERARSARGSDDGSVAHAPALSAILEEKGRSGFHAYETLLLDGEIAALTNGVEGVGVLEQGSEGEVILSATPFYPEGGGQVGDKGEIRTASGSFSVETTRWGIPGLIVHKGKVIAGSIHPGEEARATVFPEHRFGVTQSHTATHMLHWVLRDRLGEHAKQQGSLVEPGRLRFDFSHFEGLSREQLDDIEAELNQRAQINDQVRAFETTFDYAMSVGAMALFGEKYGDVVRMVEVGDYSKELCGGTHVVQTGQIGVIKLMGEGSVAAGVRRIEALVGSAGLAHLNSQAVRLRRAAEMLKTDPEHVVERLTKTLDLVADLESQLARQKGDALREEIERVINSGEVETLGPHRLAVLRRDSEPVDDLRKMAVALRTAIGSGIVAIGTVSNGKANLIVGVSKDLVDRGVSAQTLVVEGANLLGGGGGGKPDLAVSGGPSVDQLDGALMAVQATARSQLTGTS